MLYNFWKLDAVIIQQDQNEHQADICSVCIFEGVSIRFYQKTPDYYGNWLKICISLRRVSFFGLVIETHILTQL
jgi:hypothetical protein